MPESSPRWGFHPMFDARVHAALRELGDERDPLRVASALRRRIGAELARPAAELFRLRAKAKRKFPEAPPAFLTAKALEQASSEAVARARARRIAPLAGREVVADLTCGIGADSAALARAGTRVVACDRDPLLVRCARANFRAAGLRGGFAVAEAQRPAARAELFLVDPDRRAGGRRTLDPSAWSPPLEFLVELVRRARGVCIKLAPSFEPEALEAALPPELPRSWQWVSSRRELAECCLWSGRFAGGAASEREATAIDASGAEHSIRGEPCEVEPLAPEQLERARWIADPDPALVRSGLLGCFARSAGLRTLDARIAFLAGSERPSSPFLRVWRILGASSLDPRRVRELLAAHEVGPLSVHVRGHPDPPERLERRFAGRGRRAGELVVARIGDGHRAFLVERAPEERTGVVGDEGFEPPTSSL